MVERVPIEIENFKYLAISTSSIEGLLSHVKDLQLTIDESEEAGYCDCDVLCTDLETCTSVRYQDILFISSSDKFHRISKRKNMAEKFETINALLKQHKVDDVICIECSNLQCAMSIIGMIEKYHHCGFFSPYSLQNIKYINNEILVCTFDTESG